MFVDVSAIPFVPMLRTNWRAIRDELFALGDSRFVPWPEKDLYESGWDVFGLHAFGKRDEANCQRAPVTASIVEQIPGLVTAGFSSMKSMTYITPHVGYEYVANPDGSLSTERKLNTTVYRLHMGIVVPETYTELGCAIRVGEHVAGWKEGECLCFDDAIEHEAWNRSAGTRVVLLVDFLKSVVA